MDRVFVDVNTKSVCNTSTLPNQGSELRNQVLIQCFSTGEAASEVTATCNWSHRLLQVNSCSHRLLYFDACFPKLLQCLYSCRMLESRPHAFYVDLRVGRVGAARWGCRVQQDGDDGCNKMGMLSAARWDAGCSKTGIGGAARWGWEVQQDEIAGSSKMGMGGAEKWGC